MTEHVPMRLVKWPFFLADLLLLGLAGIIIQQSGHPMQMWQALVCLAAVSLGGILAVTPYLREFRASVEITEANAVSTAVAELKNLEQVKRQIAQATSQWGVVQDQCSKTVQTATSLVDRMRAEAEQFCAFFEKMNQSEKAHLRLEVDKLKRSEGEWLQVTVRILDHIYALHQAAARSGQPALMSQLNQFQSACREAARRVGLIPFTAPRDAAFDPKVHQSMDAQGETDAHSQVAETLASGYTYQSQLIRKALVSLRPSNQPELPLAAGEPERNGAEVSNAPGEIVNRIESTVESRESAANKP